MELKVKVKVTPQQAKVAQGVPGRLRPWIFLTFDTTRVVGQPYAPAAFTPGEIPGTHFQRVRRPQGTWFCRWEPRKKSPVTPPGIDPGTVWLVAQRKPNPCYSLRCLLMSPVMWSMQEWLYRPKDVNLSFRTSLWTQLALWLVGYVSGSRHVLGHQDPSKCWVLLTSQNAASHPRKHKQLRSSFLRDNYEHWNIKVKELLGNVCYMAHIDRNAHSNFNLSSARHTAAHFCEIFFKTTVFKRCVYVFLTTKIKSGTIFPGP